ncbi:MAG: G/U mismatch-specific DNA glycosylase [Thermoguttaceae bacterium]
MQPLRPSAAELLAAIGRGVPDVLGPGLGVLFCGINPGLYSAAVKHHFARPGNRFWPALHEAGFTPRLFSPWDERELLTLRLGVTNLVNCATAAASELTPDQLRRGGQQLLRKIRRCRPRFLAVLGVGAYRRAFHRPGATPGRQADSLGATVVWLLPNPSGLNAHYQLADLVAQFRSLREAVERER